MSNLGQQIFPRVYDSSLWWAERRGMRALRRLLLSGARGRVLEIGAGTGLNVSLYPGGLDEVVFSEPEPAMAAGVERRIAARTDLNARFLPAGAEELPVADAAFDTVVSTLVLCTVPDPAAALSEIRRVLAPEGRLLFLEHVRATPGSALERWQDRLHAPWHAVAAGCHCNRDTVRLIREASFALEEPRRERWRGMPPVVQPLASGEARPRR